MMNGMIRIAPHITDICRDILGMLPQRYTDAYHSLSKQNAERLTEIRIRADHPCSFTVGGMNIPMRDTNGRLISSDITEIADITERLCDGSVYSFSEQIRDGYIPYHGTRVGVCGTGICIDSGYVGQRKLTSLTFRIPGYYPGAADAVLSHIKRCGFENTMGILAVSPPNCGKTTFLRALAAGLSDAAGVLPPRRVCIIDERCELYDREMSVGCLCDVICGIPKIRALEMVTRSMSPEVVIVDEIGNEQEAQMLCRACSGGIYIAASMHGNSIADVLRTDCMKKAFERGVFSTVYLIDDGYSGKLIPVSSVLTV